MAIQSNYLPWQKQFGQGCTVKTMALTSFLGGVKFSAPGGIDVQIAAGDFTARVAASPAEPALALVDIAKIPARPWRFHARVGTWCLSDLSNGADAVEKQNFGQTICGGFCKMNFAGPTK